MDALSVVALVIALAVGAWEWRVVLELRRIREELEGLREDRLE